MVAVSILKNRKTAIISKGLTDRHVIWHYDALQTFEHPKRRTAAILKVEKSQYLGNGLTDRHDLSQ